MPQSNDAPIIALIVLAWLTTVSGSAATDHAPATGPPCRVALSATSTRAIVGQQIVATFQIARRQPDATAPGAERIEWIHAPSFGDFRSEQLPHGAELPAIDSGPSTWWVRDERHALFPTRTGSFVLDGFALRCFEPTVEGASPRTHRIKAAPLSIEVAHPPSAGRPVDFDGAVGPLMIQASAHPTELVLGQSVRVSIVVRGTGDLRSIGSPVSGADWTHPVDLFAEKPRLEREFGDRLFLRRTFRFDVVPKRAGLQTIPAFEIPYYDPDSGEYRRASTRPIDLQVSEPAVRGSTPPDGRALRAR